MSLTHEKLKKMNKDVLAGVVLHYKERFDSTLSAINDGLKELKTNFRKLETDLAIVTTSTKNSPRSLFWNKKNFRQTNNTPVKNALNF